MGRVIKMGIAAGSLSVESAGISKPDAIVVGTALGSLGDTEKFLLSVINNNEQYLTPTNFIQSLQNTVAAQIALKFGCNGHNFTFTHKGFSFESALLDGMMLLHDGFVRNVLVGGVDELTDYNFVFYEKLGAWKKNVPENGRLFESGTKGTIGGEGANFFVLDSIPGQGDYARIIALDFFSIEATIQSQVADKISLLLNKYGISLEDISLILLGKNGCIEHDRVYEALETGILYGMNVGYFKHLCGEYQTSSAFALWITAHMLKSGEVPSVISAAHENKPLNYVMICSNYENNFSLMLLGSPVAC
jgi:3-oxoacyl-(acyl-carrier-protein) synthase